VLFERFIDEVWLARAHLAFHILAAIVKKNEQLTRSILLSLDAQRKLTTKHLSRMVKNTFGITRINFFFTNFIERVGMPEFCVGFAEQKADSRPVLSISQTAL
jgi:hypothetical protein